MDKSVNNNDIFKSIKESMGLKEINIVDYSPMTLAYLGDGSYEIVNRANRQVNKIHKAAADLVKAKTQSDMILSLYEDLTEDEARVYKRGRNAKAITRAKNASMGDYRRATGFEAVMGYLYLTEQSERMMELIKKGLNNIKEDKE